MISKRLYYVTLKEIALDRGLTQDEWLSIEDFLFGNDSSTSKKYTTGDPYITLVPIDHLIEVLEEDNDEDERPLCYIRFLTGVAMLSIKRPNCLVSIGIDPKEFDED